MNIDLKQLETFIWVADLGSFRKAAVRLNTTQPNISTRISRLETTLNTILMERDAGSVRLTASGRDLLTYARDVVLRAEDLMAAAKQPGLFDGVLKLGVTEIIVHTWLRTYLNFLNQRFPNLAVELIVDFSLNLEQQLIERSLDLTFQSEPFSHRITGSDELGVFPYVWVASPDIGLHPSEDVTIDQLTEYAILTHATNTQPWSQVTEHFSQYSKHRVKLVPCNNLYACVDMIVDSMGISAMPKAMVARSIAAGELVEINYQWVPDSLAFFARYDVHRTSHVIEAATQIAQQVAAQFHIAELIPNEPLSIGVS